ncbi:MAG: hypothetical protein GY769_25110 [bacterium]|nr:hypothetical protein [bacterium]
MRPENLHPTDRRRQRRRRDVAFGGYLYIGWMLATAFLLNWIPVATPGYWAVGSFLSYPALVLAVPAGLLALVYTVVVWRERSLWLMAALTAAVWPALWSAARLADPWSAAVGAFFVGLTVLLLALPLGWFSSWRRPWRRALPGEPEEESKRPW